MRDFNEPNSDSALIATIHHECFLMKYSFEQFAELGEKQIMKGLTKKEQVHLFTAYLTFLHHLYELYVACFMRDQGSDAGFIGRGSSEKRDNLFLSETNRVFRAIVSDIEHGRAESWRNDISCYLGEVPREFVEQFRLLRNRIAHAVPDRSEDDIDLTEFYGKYHKFIYELYRSVMRYWGGYEIDKLDLKAIERFSVKIRSTKKV